MATTEQIAAACRKGQTAVMASETAAAYRVGQVYQVGTAPDGSAVNVTVDAAMKARMDTAKTSAIAAFKAAAAAL